MPNGDHHGPSWAEDHYEQVRNALRRLLAALGTSNQPVDLTTVEEYHAARRAYASSAEEGEPTEPLPDATLRAQRRAEEDRQIQNDIAQHEAEIEELRRRL